MQLPIRRSNAIGFYRHNGVPYSATVVRHFEEACNHKQGELGCQSCTRTHKRPVEVFSVLAERGIEGVDEVAEVRREDNDAGSAYGG